jgi:hypothetical protein
MPTRLSLANEGCSWGLLGTPRSTLRYTPAHRVSTSYVTNLHKQLLSSFHVESPSTNIAVKQSEPVKHPLNTHIVSDFRHRHPIRLTLGQDNAVSIMNGIPFFHSSKSEANSNNNHNTAPATRIGHGTGTGNGNSLNINVSLFDNLFGKKTIVEPKPQGVSAGNVAAIVGGAALIAGATYGVTKLLDSEKDKKQGPEKGGNSNKFDLTTLEGVDRYVGYR